MDGVNVREIVVHGRDCDTGCDICTQPHLVTPVRSPTFVPSLSPTLLILGADDRTVSHRQSSRRTLTVCNMRWLALLSICR